MKQWGYSISAAVLAAIAVPTAVFAQSARLKVYDIPAQDLGIALKTFATISGREVVAPSSILAGKLSSSARGSLDAAEALSRILSGTGLTYHLVDGAFVIGPLAPANPGEQASEPKSDIVVTGSRIRGAPVASQIISLGQDQIRREGQASLADVARTLPESWSGGQNPGLGGNVPATSGADVGGGSSLNLRGLGSDATLTLLDGHRLSYNAAQQSIDISAIPLGIVDRIEVVPDGASALYGSDAVAGVANVILRHDYDGFEARARLGTATEGGDFQQRYGLTAGTSWTSGGVIAAYEFARATAVYGDQRSYAKKASPTLTLLPPTKNHSLALSGHQSLGGGLTLEVDALANERRTSFSYANNVAGDLQSGGLLYRFHNESYLVAPTLRWAPGGSWRLFASGSYGRDVTHFTTALYNAGVATKSPRSCYCNGAQTIEVGGDGDLATLAAGSLGLALGAGYRNNDFERFQGTSNPQNVVRSQDSYYAYGELSLPLIAPLQQSPLGYRLSASAALRYERYPGIDHVVTPKLGLIYAPMPDLDLKASWGKSFRAPTLLEQYGAPSIVLIAPSAFGGSDYPPGSVGMFIEGGDPALKPERATTWSATVDAHPRALAGVTVSASYFNIAYRDRIVTPIGLINQALSNPVYAGAITRNPDAALVSALLASTSDIGNYTGGPVDPAGIAVLVDDRNVNAGRQSIDGVDLLASYNAPIAPKQRLIVSANATYLHSEQQVSAGRPVQRLAGTIFNPPTWRARGSLSWQIGHWSLSAVANHIGVVRDIRLKPSPAIGPETTLDLAFRVTTAGRGALGGIELSASAINVFDAKPPRIATTFLKDAPFDSTNYTAVGRFIAVEVAKKW